MKDEGKRDTYERGAQKEWGHRNIYNKTCVRETSLQKIEIRYLEIDSG